MLLGPSDSYRWQSKERESKNERERGREQERASEGRTTCISSVVYGSLIPPADADGAITITINQLHVETKRFSNAQWAHFSWSCVSAWLGWVGWKSAGLRAARLWHLENYSFCGHKLCVTWHLFHVSVVDDDDDNDQGNRFEDRCCR